MLATVGGLSRFLVLMHYSIPFSQRNREQTLKNNSMGICRGREELVEISTILYIFISFFKKSTGISSPMGQVSMVFFSSRNNCPQWSFKERTKNEIYPDICFVLQKCTFKCINTSLRKVLQILSYRGRFYLIRITAVDRELVMIKPKIRLCTVFFVLGQIFCFDSRFIAVVWMVKYLFQRQRINQRRHGAVYLSKSYFIW